MTKKDLRVWHVVVVIVQTITLADGESAVEDTESCSYD